MLNYAIYEGSSDDARKLAFGGTTDVGLRRSHNEDRFCVQPETGLFVVVDGVGGHTAGQVAAQTTVDTIQQFIQDTTEDKDKTWPFGIDPELSAAGNRLRTAVLIANPSVFRPLDKISG